MSEQSGAQDCGTDMCGVGGPAAEPLPAGATGYVARPDYRVDVRRKRNLVQVTHGDLVLAETTAALFVDEQDHALAVYVPRADVRTENLVPSDRTSRCPYKGQAQYWRLPDDSDAIAWEYPDPYVEVAILRDHVAFYQDRAVVRIGTAGRTVPTAQECSGSQTTPPLT